MFATDDFCPGIWGHHSQEMLTSHNPNLKITKMFTTQIAPVNSLDR
jgi:hypothetical protein